MMSVKSKKWLRIVRSLWFNITLSHVSFLSHQQLPPPPDLRQPLPEHTVISRPPAGAIKATLRRRATRATLHRRITQDDPLQDLTHLLPPQVIGAPRHHPPASTDDDTFQNHRPRTRDRRHLPFLLSAFFFLLFTPLISYLLFCQLLFSFDGDDIVDVGGGVRWWWAGGGGRWEEQG